MREGARKMQGMEPKNNGYYIYNERFTCIRLYRVEHIAEYAPAPHQS